jgi:hypothetical protein
VALIYQSLQSIWASIGVLHCEGIGTIISPISTPWKLRHGHKLNGCYAQILELIQMGNDGLKSPPRGKGSHVELVNDVVLEGKAKPGIILPGELRINYPRGSVHALGLRSGSRIRELLLAIEAIKVSVSRFYPLDDGIMVPCPFFL